MPDVSQQEKQLGALLKRRRKNTMVYPNPDRLKSALLILAASGLALGLLLYALDRPDAARLAWQAGVVPVLVALILEHRT